MNKYRREFLKEKEQDFLRETNDNEEIKIEKKFNDLISEILEDIEEYNSEQKKEIFNYLCNITTIKAKCSVLRKKQDKIKEQIIRAVKTNIKNFTSF